MYSIGELASIARVSVRMLRHYHAIGLLVPASVDESTGYRRYDEAQLAALSRIVELRGLGLGLDDIGVVVSDPDETERIMASARGALERSLADDSARLARIDAALRRIRGETVMPTSGTIAVEVRPVDAQHVATLTRRADGFGSRSIGPVVGPMFPEIAGLLDTGGVREYGPAVALYEADESGDGSGVLVTAGFVVPRSVAGVAGLEVHELPAQSHAAIAVHRGAPDGIDATWEAVLEWTRENGWEPDAVSREVYWTPGDRPREEWVTDVVQPVRRAG